jgi:hypothetical protein
MDKLFGATPLATLSFLRPNKRQQSVSSPRFGEVLPLGKMSSRELRALASQRKTEDEIRVLKHFIQPAADEFVRKRTMGTHGSLSQIDETLGDLRERTLRGELPPDDQAKRIIQSSLLNIKNSVPRRAIYFRYQGKARLATGQDAEKLFELFIQGRNKVMPEYSFYDNEKLRLQKYVLDLDAKLSRCKPARREELTRLMDALLDASKA